MSGTIYPVGPEQSVHKTYRPTAVNKPTAPSNTPSQADSVQADFHFSVTASNALPLEALSKIPEASFFNGPAPKLQSVAGLSNLSFGYLVSGVSAHKAMGPNAPGLKASLTSAIGRL